MINRICCVCGEYVSEVWTIELKDDKNKIELSGCKKHIDELHIKINNVKGLDKKNIDKVLKEINLKGGVMNG